MPFIPGQGWVVNATAPTSGVAPGYGYSAPSAQYDVYGNISNSGQVAGNLGNVYGHNDILNTPEHGAGQSFAAEREAQSVNTLGSGMTNSEGDVNLRDQLRNSIASQYSQFNPNAQFGNLNSMYDKGLNNSLTSARRALAGTGLSGSSQASRGIGDIVAQSNAARLGAQADLQGKQANTLGVLAGTEGSNLQQSLAERGYSLQQANTLASLLEQQAQNQYNYLTGNASVNAQASANPSGLDKALGYVLGAGGVAAKFAGGK